MVSARSPMNKGFAYYLLDLEILHVLNIDLHTDLNLASLPFEKRSKGNAKLMVVLDRGSATLATAYGIDMLLKLQHRKKGVKRT